MPYSMDVSEATHAMKLAYHPSLGLIASTGCLEPAPSPLGASRLVGRNACDPPSACSPVLPLACAQDCLLRRLRTDCVTAWHIEDGRIVFRVARVSPLQRLSAGLSIFCRVRYLQSHRGAVDWSGAPRQPHLHPYRNLGRSRLCCHGRDRPQPHRDRQADPGGMLCQRSRHCARSGHPVRQLQYLG